jgi:hypothetical protein
MNYSLGNMLGGAGALNADKLSLDLQFAADKTLTARKGPTPTFTRASSATFVGSDGLIQSAAINAPRFDHDPVTLACKGLLIEEARTNLLARSEEFGNAYWAISNASISENSQTSPNGSLTADTITVSAGTPSLYRAVACTASTLYTFSFYIKIGTLTPSDFKFAVRDDTNGVFIAENIVPNVTPVTTEWRRVTYTFTTPVGCVTVRPYLMRYGYIAGGTVFLWGAQLEAGSFPTSYIPTVASSVVRSADVCSITGSAFTGMYNQSEGTFFTQSTKISTNANAFIFHVSDNSFLNGLDLRYSSATNPAALMNVSNVNQLTGFNATITSGSSPKQAVAYKLNDCAYSANGASVITDTSALIPTVSRLNIGGAFNNTLAINGHIATLRYYKKRLANAKLTSLTA